MTALCATYSASEYLHHTEHRACKVTAELTLSALWAGSASLMRVWVCCQTLLWLYSSSPLLCQHVCTSTTCLTMRPDWLDQPMLSKIKPKHMKDLLIIMQQKHRTVQWRWRESTQKAPMTLIFPEMINAPWPQRVGLTVPGTGFSARESVKRGDAATPLCLTLQDRLGASTPVCTLVTKWVPSLPPHEARLPPWLVPPPPISPEISPLYT